MNKKTNETLTNHLKERRFWGSLQFKLPVYFAIGLLVCFYAVLVAVGYQMQQHIADKNITEELLLKVAIFGTVGVIVIAVALMMYIRTQISNPITSIKQQADNLAEGLYDTPQQHYFSSNELRILGDTISELGLKIKDVNATTLAQSQRLDSVLTHMSDGVIATDRRGNIVLANDAALVLLNLHRDELINQSIMDVFEIREKYTFRQLLETDDELILMTGIESEKAIIRGEFSVIKRPSGFVSGIVCVLSDITEQEKMEQERREFVSNVSHELRTPLTSMRSYTEALIDGAWKDKELAPNFLNVIQSETERLIRMVSDLLNLSELDSDQDVRFELVDLTDVVQRICNRYDMLLSSSIYDGRKYLLHRQLVHQSCWVEADEDKLTQVIDNILNNAIKYSPDGGTIKCQLVTTETHIILSVSDEGLGIPLKAIPNIFKRFYRVDKARSREQGGTGLGLSIAKEVVELHKGKIWVTSRENQGSTFFVSLPKATFEDDWDE